MLFITEYLNALLDTSLVYYVFQRCGNIFWKARPPFLLFRKRVILLINIICDNT
jgi:hypothetical protein